MDPPTLSLLLEINQELKNNSQEEENKYKLERKRTDQASAAALTADRAKRQLRLMPLEQTPEGLDDLLSDIRDEEPEKKPEDFPIIDQGYWMNLTQKRRVKKRWMMSLTQSLRSSLKIKKR